MRTFISILFLMAFSNLYAATITAKLNVNPVLVNDTFQLTYTASGSIDDEPDFSPIENIFELLGTQQSSNMSMINGNISRSKTWRLTLLSKAVGSFIIPAISFGSDRAPEVKVVIKNIVTSNSATPNKNFILEMTTSEKTGYVQQQFIITVKLFISQNINSYQFGELKTSNPDTLIYPLGKDEQYKTYRGTKQYVVVEKKFALFPQTAETLKIKPFIGAVTMQSQSRGSFYDPFNSRTTSKRLYSQDINLTIKVLPAQISSNNWLPSSSVTLKEEWPQSYNFVAGEPITRTLTLKAEGLTSAQLPEINQPVISGLKQYPDKPEAEEKPTTTGITSIRKQKIALIPTQAGSYTLPAISVQWWNTKTQKQETVRLKERKFTVLPARNNGNIPITSTKQPVDTSVKASASATPLTDNSEAENGNHFWFWISSLFIFLWLATVVLWWRSTHKMPNKKEQPAQTSPSLNACLKNLNSACMENNAQDTKKALLDWAKIIFTETQPNNLSEISKYVDPPLQQRITELNAYLYRPSVSEWTCQDIYEQCKNFKKSKSTETNKINAATLEPFKRSS